MTDAGFSTIDQLPIHTSGGKMYNFKGVISAVTWIQNSLHTRATILLLDVDKQYTLCANVVLFSVKSFSMNQQICLLFELHEVLHFLFFFDTTGK